jgi:predicted dehydrogenase
MQIQSYIMGHGRAGRAIQDSISILRSGYPQLELAPAQFLPRGEVPLAPAGELALLFLANPSGLHGQMLLSAAEKGYRGIGCEKPVCTELHEAEALVQLSLKAAVFHGYRQQWGLQEIKRLITAGELGEIISIEGRYWQSSAAERALRPNPNQSWKNDLALNGPSDTLLDIGTHWIDAAAFLAGELPSSIQGRLSYHNAEAPHRDTHVNLQLHFSNGINAYSSISKTVHGASNQFEISVLGTKKCAHWQFLLPDEIVLGEGKVRSILQRQSNSIGSGYTPYHGLGWIEGYVEVIKQLVLDIRGETSTSYPSVQESARLMAKILKSGLIAR